MILISKMEDEKDKSQRILITILRGEKDKSQRNLIAILRDKHEVPSLFIDSSPDGIQTSYAKSSVCSDY